MASKGTRYTILIDVVDEGFAGIEQRALGRTAILNLLQAKGKL